MKNILFIGLMSCVWSQTTAQQEHQLPARVEIASRMVGEHAAPIGVNDFGDSGGTHYSAGNLIPGAGFEPLQIRRRWIVTSSGTENGRPWVELDGGGVTNWDLVTSGYLSGSDYRLYRLVDASGNPLPWSGGQLQQTDAAQYIQVSNGKIPPEGTVDLPNGGWVNTLYGTPGQVQGARAETTYTDVFPLENGQTYYYIVTAVSGTAASVWNCLESDPSAAVEVAVTPQAGNTPGIYIGIEYGDNFHEMPPVSANGWFDFRPKAVGAVGNQSWELLNEDGSTYTIPTGFAFDATTGQLSGQPTVVPPGARLRLRVTADNGSAERLLLFNPTPWSPSGSTVGPQGVSNLTAVAGDGFVRLTWDASPSSDVVGYRIYRSTAPRAQQRQRVYLETNAAQPRPGDYIHFDKRMLTGDPDWAHPRVWTGNFGETWANAYASSGTISRVAHPTTTPAAMRFPGESCIRFDLNTNTTETFRGPYFLFPRNENSESEWYGVLEPGMTYVYEAWMRKSGSSGTIRMGFVGQYTTIGQNFTVGNDWQLCRFTFIAPPAPTTGSHGAPAIQATGPGTVWMDNIRLFRLADGADPDDLFHPSPVVFDELMASQPHTGEKGMLRSMWIMLGQSSMASLLSPYADDGADFDWYQAANPHRSMTLPGFLDYAFRTGTTPDSRMKPWLNLSSNVTEQEWAMLVEYLSAPIDSSDPTEIATKPWAALRAKIRGTDTPWTDEFPKIYIEFANETWHNSAVEQEWFGWGPTGGIFQGGKAFGLVARYFSDRLAADSPWFESVRSSGKLSLLMGSSYDNYAELGILEAPSVSGIGHTTYVGPRWETGDTPNTNFDDHGVQATLFGYIADTAPNYYQRYRKLRENSHAAGVPFELLGYEGGPSGYSLPGTADAASVEISEQYGKSLAMAVAALDGWLGANQFGFTDQGQLSFMQGSYWSSHTPMAQGFRRHVPWLALMMRNRYASGQMITADVKSGPVLDWDGINIPLVGAYAFRDGAKLSIFLLSRKLGGIHDGHDFGDGSTQVTLALPSAPVGSATLYRLEGDPRSSNRQSMQVDIQQSVVALGQESTITLPQGSIYLYVVNTELSTTVTPPARTEAPALTYAPGETLLNWSPIAGSTGYRVYRSSTIGFQRDQAEAVFDTTQPTFSDTEAGGGSTFYYRVSAINNWGEGLESIYASGGTNPQAPLYAAPINLRATADENRLLLSWSAVTGAQGYRIGLRTRGTGIYTWLDVGNRTEWFYQGLTNDTTYEWVVQPYGVLGFGMISERSNATPRASSSSGMLGAWEFGALESWETTTPATETAVAASAGEFSRGPGLTSAEYGYHAMPGAFGFIPTDANDQGNFAAGGGTLATAMARDFYLTFSISPKPGYALKIDRLLTGGIYPYKVDPTIPLQIALSYQVGSGSWNTLSSEYAITTTDFNADDIAFELSSETSLQNIHDMVRFRLYVYTATDSRFCRAGILRSSGPDVVVEGSWMNELPAFPAWQARYFTPSEMSTGVAAANQDPDGDGRDTGLEFAFGTNPYQKTSRPALQFTTQGNKIRLQTPSIVQDVLMWIEHSPDLVHYDPLATWSNQSWHSFHPEIVFDGSDPNLSGFEIPISITPDFLRVRVDVTPSNQ